MIRLGIAEDNKQVQTAIRLLLSLSPKVEVVFGVENGREAVDCVQQYQPDVLVMDIRMPGLNGLAATGQIVSQFPTRVILISSYNEAVIIEAAREVGAHGFVSKSDLVEQLRGAVETAYQGGLFFPE